VLTSASSCVPVVQTSSYKRTGLTGWLALTAWSAVGSVSRVTTLQIPRYLAETARDDPSVRDWIAELPAIVTDLASQWSLEVDEPFQPGGQCSWTAPVTGASGTRLVLKVAFPFPSGEERHEAAGLRVRDGNATVRLHASQETELARALLIERCLPGTPLGLALPEPEQDQVVARLLGRLWAQPCADYPFRSLAEMCEAWSDEFEREYATARGAAHIDPGLARAGIAMFRELPNSADRQVLLCTDLHGDNILAAEREPWLVIDPKPYLGDPAYDVLQHMLNCDDRLAADPAGLANRMAGLAGLEARRVRQWLFARSVQESIGSRLMCQVAQLLRDQC
jgi:streptomycin 6-kinase